jgi:hypothetical protein
MKNLNSVKASANAGKVAAAVLGAGLFAFAGACAAEDQPQTYEWSAELVAFDQATNTVTVKARLVETADPATDIEAGERAVLTWSGISTAAGVRDIEPGSQSSYDRMTLPVELVGSELDGRYVTFKVPIPADDADALAGLSPGQWVTATSPHLPQNASEAVSSIRSYNDVG